MKKTNGFGLFGIIVIMIVTAIITSIATGVIMLNSSTEIAGESLSSITKDEKLTQEYAKCTIFDYSYKYFYNDGYGKEYQILNLSDDSNETFYITKCL